MAHLTKPPGFGTNSWDESTWAAAMAAQLPRFRVADAAAWRPTVVAGLDRTVQIAAGAAWGCGVFDRTDAVENVQFPANGGAGDRYDLLVARWNWTTRTVTFATITGTATPPVVNTSTTVVDSTKVNRIPGSRYDAVIAMLRVRPGVGAFASTDLFDLRPVGAATGALIVPQTNFIALVDGAIGAELRASNQLTLLHRHDGTTWRPQVSNRIFTPTAYTWGGTGLAVVSGGSEETGYGELGALPSLVLLTATRVRLSAQVRASSSGGAAQFRLLVDGVDRGLPGIVRTDHTITISATADLAAGTHVPSIRLDALGAAATWVSFYFEAFEGIAA